MRREARLVRDFAAALEGRGVSSARRDPALAPLLRLAQGLEAVPTAAAPDFKDALRQRLLAVASVAPAPVAVRSPLDRAKTWVEGWRVQKALAATSAAMAGVVGIAGVSVASSRSLPGDPFYGVKRSAEGLQLTFSRNDVNRGKRHLQHAETRLHEVAHIVGTDIALAPAPTGPGQITVAFGGSRSARIASALRAMDADTREGTKLLFDAYAAERDESVLHAVQDFADRQRTRLDQVMDALPTDAHDAAQQSLSLVSDLSMRATQLLGGGIQDTPSVSTPAPTSTALPTPAPTPSYDGPSGQPCYCAPPPTDEPSPSEQPTPSPTPSDEPSQTPPPVTVSPQPEPSHYPLPSQLPSPVASVLQPIVDQIDKSAPTPLPTVPPVPSAAPPVPGDAS